jgi:hypothetical protein
MKYNFTNTDYNYREALNYDGTNFYNAPITINIAGKLFILPFGTSDRKSVTIKDNYAYIIGENRGLDYISMSVIDLSDNTVESCYLSDNDLNDPECFSYDLLNKDTEEQIKILLEYL